MPRDKPWILRQLYLLERERIHQTKVYDAKRQMYTEQLAQVDKLELTSYDERTNKH